MHLFRRLPLLLIVSALSFSTSTPARTPARTPDQTARLQVSLFNDAHIDAATLAEAETRASFLFSKAGIEIDWLACRPADPSDFSPSTSPCSALAWPAHLSVRINPHAFGVSPETFGQAFVDPSGQGVYSNIYYQNLALSSNHPQLSDGDMLGFVIAHELGHLLLGSNSHSPFGLMQARWDSVALHAASHSALFFTPAQSALLRSRLSESANALAAPLPLYASARPLPMP
jgi:hypothetical protein